MSSFFLIVFNPLFFSKIEIQGFRHRRFPTPTISHKLNSCLVFLGKFKQYIKRRKTGNLILLRPLDFTYTHSLVINSFPTLSHLRLNFVDSRISLNEATKPSLINITHNIGLRQKANVIKTPVAHTANARPRRSEMEKQQLFHMVCTGEQKKTLSVRMLWNFQFSLPLQRTFRESPKARPLEKAHLASCFETTTRRKNRKSIKFSLRLGDAAENF